MGVFSKAKSSLRPSSKTSVDGSAASTLAPSAEPSVMEKNTHPSSQDGHTAENKEVAVANENEMDTKEKEAAAIEIAKEQDSAENLDEDDYDYPKSWKLGLITISLCLSVFCMALDNTIIATAIPRITDQFKALNDVGWYGSAYLLCTCAFQLLFGKLYTFYSIKWTYLAALGIFEVGSLLCGVAPNSTALIIGRAVAGLGSAGIFSGAILIVAHTVPLRQRPTFTGMIGAMYGVASVAGPLMGGAFTDKLTWRWCFYINLPFGAVTAIFIIFFFTSPKKVKATTTNWKGKLEQLDVLGTAFFLPGIICLLLALQWGGTKYPWSNGRIIALFVLFGLLISAFVAVQIWKGEMATVPPRVFKDRNVWGSAFFGAMLGGAFFILCFYIPIWFQAIKGASAVKSGIMNLPLILGLVVISMVAGGLVSWLGYYTPFMYASTVLMAIGAGLLTTFKTDSDHSKWIGYQFLFGAGIGLGMQQTLIAAQTALPAADIPIGTAIMMFAQTLGGALMVSVGQNVFSNQLSKNLLARVPDLDPTIVLRAGATELKHAIPSQFLSGVLEAYNKALVETWYVALALSILSGFGCAVIQWKSVKGKKIEAIGGA